MYIDELVWLVYRTKAAKETDDDQQVGGMKHTCRELKVVESPPKA
jgi:hypothetical protein